MESSSILCNVQMKQFTRMNIELIILRKKIEEYNPRSVMERRVFISHAVEDRAEATAICRGLEALAVRCWIAPRDIRSGATWARALIDGVNECSDMVLVLSEHANNSPSRCR